MNSAAPLAVYVHWPYCARICPYCDFNVVRDRGQARAGRAGPGHRRATCEAPGGADRPAAAGVDLLRRRHALADGPGLGGRDHRRRRGGCGRRPTPSRSRWRPTRPTPRPAASPPSPRPGVEPAVAGRPVARRRGAGHARPQPRRGRGPAGGGAWPARCFPRLSIDLIYALPGQTPRAWAEELRAALAFGPEHLSPYQLTIEPGTAFDRAVRRGSLVPPGRRHRRPPSTRPPRTCSPAPASTPMRSPTMRGAGRALAPQPRLLAGLGLRRRRPRRPWPADAGRRCASATTSARRVGDYIALVERSGTGLAEREALSLRDAALERLLMGLRTDEGVALAELAPHRPGSRRSASRRLRRTGPDQPRPGSHRRHRRRPAGARPADGGTGRLTPGWRPAG